MTKVGLSQAELSLYEWLLFLGNFVSFFWIMGGLNALLQYFPKLDIATQKRAFYNTFLFFLILSLLAAGLLWLLQDLILKNFTVYENLPHIDLICIFIIFHGPTFLIHIYFLLLKRFKAILWFGIISFGLQIVVVVLPILLGYSIREALFGLIFLSVLKFMLLLFQLIKFSTFQLDASYFKTYGLLTLPLVLHVLIGNSVEYIDGIIVQGFFMEEEKFVIFRYGAKELPLSLLIIGALVTALIPETTANLKNGMQRIKEKTNQLSHWLYPLSIILMFLSPFVFPLVYTPEFAESAMVFNVYLLILTSRILLPQVILLSQQKNYVLVWSAIIETIINVALSLVLVQSYGLAGIAFASVIAYLINKVNMIIYNKKVLKIDLKDYVNIRNYCIYNGLLILSFIGSLYLKF